MKAILALSVFMVMASLAATVRAQEKTVTPSDKYGPGGTVESSFDEKTNLLSQIYRDKCGRLRESYVNGESEKGERYTKYFSESGSLAVTVVHMPQGDEYYNPGGSAMPEGKAVVAKLEKTPSGPCPEKTTTAPEHPKAKPELPGGALSPSFYAAHADLLGGTYGGAYAGVESAYTRSSADFSSMPTGRWNDFRDLSFELWERGQHEFDRDGGGIGAYAGYNFMLCKHFLFGLEVEGRRVWGLDGRFKTGDFPFDGLGNFDVKSRIDTPYLVTFGPRFGHPCGRFLPYVNGGLAFGEVDAHEAILTSNFGGNTSGKQSLNQVGWCVGTGLEFALTKNLRLRIAYEYTDLGTVDFTGGGHPDTFRHFTSWNSVDVTQHSGTVGLNWGFH